MKPNQESTASEPTETTPLSQERLRHLYWYRRAADCLTGGQIYLQGSSRLRKPLRPEHIKQRLSGHWETSPGLSFIYAHLKRLIGPAIRRSAGQIYHYDNPLLKAPMSPTDHVTESEEAILVRSRRQCL
jgi:hypothetical protein